MTLEERVDNLERLVNRLIDLEVGNKQYTDADIAGCRQSIGEVTPYTQTKTAYIGDTEVVFTDVPQGYLSVYLADAQIAYDVMRESDRVTVDFIEPLEEVTTVTISIM